MNIHIVLAFASAACVTGYIVYLSLKKSTASGKSHVWVGLVSAAFLAFSILAIIAEGPTGFWPLHTQNFWGNQVWFDLLLAVSIAFTFILPRARACGMQPLPWGALVLATGCIGLTAMVARVLYLERTNDRNRP